MLHRVECQFSLVCWSYCTQLCRTVNLVIPI